MPLSTIASSIQLQMASKLIITYGDILEDGLMQDDVLIINCVSSAGMRYENEKMALFMFKYSYADVIKNRQCDKKISLAHKINRSRLGSCMIFLPHYQLALNYPIIALLVTNFAEEGGMSYVTHTGRIKDDDILVNFHTAMDEFRQQFSTIKNKNNTKIQYVIIPYLCGCKHISTWNEYYLPAIHSLANELYDMNVRVVLLIPHQMEELMKHNQDLAIYTNYSNIKIPHLVYKSFTHVYKYS